MAKNSGNEKYAYLDRLSMEQLEELLRADIESPEYGDQDAIFHILEVIEKREQEHPTGRLPDEDKAWEEFQTYYNIPGEEDVIIYPEGLVGDEPDNSVGDKHGSVSAKQMQEPKVIRPHRWLKNSLIAAAAIAALMVGMVGAQAAGIDVFGAIGRWTEETFHFVPSSGAAQNSADITPCPESIGYHDSLQAALKDCGIMEDLAPAWYPAGFEASELQTLSGKLSDAVHISFSDRDEGFFNINITRYQSASNLATRTFEKDNTSVEQYTSEARTFYIMSNIDVITAIWSEGLLVEKISGNLEIDEIKAIIDSIGE